MKTKSIISSVVLVLAGAGAAIADNALSFHQTNPVNVKAVVLMGPQANRDVTIRQTGVANGAAIVSTGEGGRMVVQQTGFINSAVAGLLGSNQTGIIWQTHSELRLNLPSTTMGRR